MPYVNTDRQERADRQLPPVLDILDVGQLTYMLTRVINDYRYTHGTTFQTIAEIVGALECTKSEFQRRVVAKYEDKKIATNGDVYGELP